ncbi:MAG TPA: MFS transporter [Planctomycetaceae bacterium]|jgi:nucleoside transporter|nr:MFS transporter [Planctomycetaceae bacterium]
MFSVRLRLCVMMFLQYAIWGVWGVSIGGYMYKTLHFDGAQTGAIFSTTAVGAMISPLFVGFIADRFFSTEKMLSGLHFIGAVLLFAAAFAKEFGSLLTIMQIYALVFMPTLALTNSISFANIADSKRDFPGIRVWGTWGWIAAGLLIGLATLGETNYQFVIAAVLSVILGGFCLYLPRTLPKAAITSPPAASATPAPAAGGESIFRLLADPSFLVFVVCSLLICIPLSFYYAQAEAFLVELEAPYPPALMTVGQFSEVIFMSLMPFFIAWLGVKRMLTVGMLAWVLRYLAFASLALPVVIVGLILHGVCYDFYFVASYIYVDTRVHERQRASAQSFIAFVMLGVGMFIGSNASGWVVDRYPPEILIKATVTKPNSPTTETKVPLPEWSYATDEEHISHFAKTLNLKPDSLVKPDMIPAEYSEKDPYLNTETHYDHAGLVEAVTRADKNNDGGVSRSEWVIARRRQWPAIWLWPAAGALVTCVIFVIGFRDRVPVAGEEHVGFDAVAQTEP